MFEFCYCTYCTMYIFGSYLFLYTLLYCKRDIRLLRSIYSFEYYTIYTVEFCNTDDMSVNKCLPFISGSPADSCDMLMMNQMG